MALDREAREKQRYAKLAALCTGDGCWKGLDLYDINRRLLDLDDRPINCPHCGRELVSG